MRFSRTRLTDAVHHRHWFADDLDTVAERLHETKIKAGAAQVRTGRPVIMLPTIKGGDRDVVCLRFAWSRLGESNPRPTHYERSAWMRRRHYQH
jgi:hypothetical protein